MRAKITILGKEFEITAKHTGEIKGFPNSDDNMMHNVFEMTVKRELRNKGAKIIDGRKIEEVVI